MLIWPGQTFFFFSSNKGVKRACSERFEGKKRQGQKKIKIRSRGSRILKQLRHRQAKERADLLCLHCQRGKIKLMERLIKHFSFSSWSNPASLPAVPFYSVMILCWVAEWKMSSGPGGTSRLGSIPRPCISQGELYYLDRWIRRDSRNIYKEPLSEQRIPKSFGRFSR